MVGGDGSRRSRRSTQQLRPWFCHRRGVHRRWVPSKYQEVVATHPALFSTTTSWSKTFGKHKRPLARQTCDVVRAGADALSVSLQLTSLLRFQLPAIYLEFQFWSNALGLRGYKLTQALLWIPACSTVLHHTTLECASHNVVIGRVNGCCEHDKIQMINGRWVTDEWTRLVAEKTNETRVYCYVDVIFHQRKCWQCLAWQENVIHH